jgi:alginate O-acetyltransferase complex protein AlgI
VLFSSPVFIVFFGCYLILHWLTPTRFRIYTMIAGSAVFYGYWNWAFSGLPFVIALLAFFLTKWTMAADPMSVGVAGRKLRLGISVVVLLTPLLFFKYTNFIWTEVLGALAGLGGVAVGGKIVTVGLPLGISFVTFTLIAYLVDVSTGKYSGQTSLRSLFGYVLFFPHLIAGPILRPFELIPQLQRGMPILSRNIMPGVALFTCGLVKKLMFADPIGAVVTGIYDQPVGRGMAEYLFALYGFSVQIYCDFSGYTDMAVGLALILGVRLPGNFRRPYLATSVAGFWRRWHITLSHWLRDYVYIPLGGNRGGDGKTLRNILLTMALGGLWHGANWTFLIWGVLHGLGVAVSHFLGTRLPPWARPPRWVQVLLTFHFVALLWVFFRAPDLASAFTVLAGMFGGASPADGFAFLTRHGFEVALVLTFFVLHPWDDARRVRIAAKRYSPFVVGAVVSAAFILAFVIGSGSSGQFIYFEF